MVTERMQAKTCQLTDLLCIENMPRISSTHYNNALIQRYASWHRTALFRMRWQTHPKRRPWGWLITGEGWLCFSALIPAFYNLLLAHLLLASNLWRHFKVWEAEEITSCFAAYAQCVSMAFRKVHLHIQSALLGGLIRYVTFDQWCEIYSIYMQSIAILFF